MTAYGGGTVHRTCDDGPTCTDPKHLEVRDRPCDHAGRDWSAKGRRCHCGHQVRWVGERLDGRWEHV